MSKVTYFFGAFYDLTMRLKLSICIWTYIVLLACLSYSYETLYDCVFKKNSLISITSTTSFSNCSSNVENVTWIPELIVKKLVMYNHTSNNLNGIYKKYFPVVIFFLTLSLAIRITQIL
jgi:hypothetical protein